MNLRIYKINIGAGGIRTLEVAPLLTLIDNQQVSRQEAAQFLREARIEGLYIHREV